MKQKILLPITTLLLSASLFAQQKRSAAYAITSSIKGQFVWTDVKLIDLNTGEVIQQVYEDNKSDYNVFTAREGKPIHVKNGKGEVEDNSRLPFSTFSAACAFDKKHNRLYYSPLFINELRYIDLSAPSPKIYYFNGEAMSKDGNLANEANHITRMVIGADGNGYALSNDANHLIKFTTGSKPVITDLGLINDHESNGSISIHNRCTSWGGDMIAAADGSLYLVSASHSIFRVDITNRSAKYIGAISGLPNGYTSNGAVVDENCKLIVSSANSIDGYYSVDMNDWKAVKAPSQGQVFNTSDLANGNIAFQNKKSAETLPLVTRTLVGNHKISLYPNPVSEGIFRVRFENDELGRYEIQLVDITGRIILQKPVSIGNKGQVVHIELGKPVSKGIYLVKVIGNTKKAVYTDKIIIE